MKFPLVFYVKVNETIKGVKANIRNKILELINLCNKNENIKVYLTKLNLKQRFCTNSCYEPTNINML